MRTQGFQIHFRKDAAMEGPRYIAGNEFGANAGHGRPRYIAGTGFGATRPWKAALHRWHRVWGHAAWVGMRPSMRTQGFQIHFRTDAAMEGPGVSG
jgi:hypothetical protein